MPDVKILISCHKNTDAVHNDVLHTIEVGAALHKYPISTDYHDNVGDHISSDNLTYCELTAQYWAWKNLDADYYGFFHYRRYFSFKHLPETYDPYGNLIEDFFDTNTEEKLGLNSQSIKSFVSQYDFILPEEKDITRMPNMGKNMCSQYLSSGYLHGEDLQIMMDVLREKSPEMVPFAEKYEAGHKTWFNNMFIARKEIFQAYSAWLFDILAECCRRIDMRDYSVEARRTPGHLAERLLNIYFRYLISQKKYKYTELQTVAFLHTEPIEVLKPAFRENNIAIALSANDFYVPYVSALLLSLKAHMQKGNNYDLLVMTRDISPISQKNLRAIFVGNENVSLRFINVARFGKQFENLFLRGHFALETYFRLLMPELMKNYQKVLYLDSDLILNADPAELYQTDVEEYLLAAAHDADTAGLYNGFEPNKKAYMDNVLKIQNPFAYFQAGVILFNLEKFRKTYTTDEMLRFAASNKWELLDQDVLNYLAQGRYKAVDMAWNVMTDWRGIRIPQIISRAPKYLYDEYMAAHNAPKIIHYAGPDKPWQQPHSDYAEYFWKYARESSYYEVLLQRLAAQEVTTNCGFGIKRIVKRKLQYILDRFFPEKAKSIIIKTYGFLKHRF